ncbi:RICIN domain-containing protein [Streptomyces sp. NPDC000229]|uniref:RICIN domain-containing protein n=1 Tax=Streptomyces sp. NPDC000229 TaxID=3154247 RepID=UPI003333E506
MESQGGCELSEVQDIPAFMKSLRLLKERSGLSYRGLEQRAAAVGDVLPRSTLAAMLAHDIPPRTEILLAFVRACGDGGRAEEWLRAGERAARRAEPAALRAQPTAPRTQPSGQAGLAGAAGPDGHGAPGGRAAPGERTVPGGGVVPAGPDSMPRRRRFTAVALGVVVVAATTAAATSTLFRTGDGAKAPSASVATSTGSAPAMPSGWVTIRVAADPGLCLTDGRVRDWRHTPLVAVQRPCDEAAPQSTMLEPVRENLYRIQWHHPDYGKGCLKALTSGTGAGLLEPWDECEEGSLFRVEPSGPPAEGKFVLRVEGQGCVGIKGSSAASGAEAVMETCKGKGRQVFLIRSAH